MNTPLTLSDLRKTQARKLRRLLGEVAAGNPFYGPRIESSGLDPATCGVEDFLRAMPPTTRAEWVEDQLASPPYGTNLTYPVVSYARLCRTSGSTGKPLNWLDTTESWSAMLGNWETVYGNAGVTAADRLFFAFSFGPFLGFWTAFEAAGRLGCLCMPGGALTSSGRLRLMAECGATVLCCTPTYAIRLAEVAREEGFAPGDFSVRRVIVAGEPGGSIPEIRRRIGKAWGDALVVDQHGMTEVGPVTYQDPVDPRQLVVMESSYLAEVVTPETGMPCDPDEDGELVLTTLDRVGSPLLRYRTGDLVSAFRPPDGSPGGVDLRLRGGIKARIDDMVIIRGVNVFPSGVQAIVRSVPGVLEYQVDVKDQRTLPELALRIEVDEVHDPGEVRAGLASAFREALGLRVQIMVVPRQSLPRFEMKANRWNRASSA